MNQTLFTYIDSIHSTTDVTSTTISHSSLNFGVIITIYSILCILSMWIWCISVFKYYLQSKSTLKVLRILNIFCVTLWTISNIGWILNYIFLTMQYYNIQERLYILSIFSAAFGYHTFAIIFTIRVVKVFEGSMFELSQTVRGCVINSVIGG